MVYSCTIEDQMTRISPVLSLFALLFAASPALGQSARTHDGFYLRLGGGLGYVADSVESEDLPFVGGTIEASLTGGAFATDVALGGAVAPGLIIGGGWFAETMPSPSGNDIHYGTVD